MKTLLIGDTHGRKHWQRIVNENKDWDRLVMIGDYFDSFDIKGEDQINNFLDIIAFKESTNKEVILLIGNHDMPYMKGCETNEISGYQHNYAHLIGHALEKNKHHLQMCYKFDNVLCTHAGISEEWLKEKYPGDWSMDNLDEVVNDMWKYKPLDFAFYGFEPTGDNTWQTPIWIRPKSLLRASKNIKEHYIQVVGHTGMKQIDIEGKATGGRYYFIDTIAVGQYLIYEDGIFSLGQLNTQT